MEPAKKKKVIIIGSLAAVGLTTGAILIFGNRKPSNKAIVKASIKKNFPGEEGKVDKMTQKEINDMAAAITPPLITFNPDGSATYTFANGEEQTLSKAEVDQEKQKNVFPGQGRDGAESFQASNPPPRLVQPVQAMQAKAIGVLTAGGIIKKK